MATRITQITPNIEYPAMGESLDLSSARDMYKNFDAATDIGLTVLRVTGQNAGGIFWPIVGASKKGFGGSYKAEHDTTQTFTIPIIFPSGYNSYAVYCKYYNAGGTYASTVTLTLEKASNTPPYTAASEQIFSGTTVGLNYDWNYNTFSSIPVDDAAVSRGQLVIEVTKGSSGSQTVGNRYWDGVASINLVLFKNSA